MKAFRIYTLIMTAGPTVLAAMMVTERRNPDGLFIVALIHFAIYVVVTDINQEKPKVRRTIRIDPVDKPISDTVTTDVLKALNQLGYTKRNSHVLLDIVKKRYPHMSVPSVIVTACLKHSNEIKK